MKRWDVFPKKRARSKVLEAKSSIFHFWQKSDQRKYVYFELKYFECIHYYFLFLILCSLPTSTGGRGVKLMTMNVYLFAVDSAAPNILHICRARVTSLRSLLAVLAVIAEHDSDQKWRVIIESPIQFSNHSIKTILKTEMGP